MIVDRSRIFIIAGNGLDLACLNTGTGVVENGSVGANLGALTALDTLGFVDVSNVVIIKGDRPSFAYVLATVSQAATAGRGHLIAAHGAFIAGNLNDLNHIGVAAVTAHGKLHTLCHDGTLLVDTAPHGRLTFGNDNIGNIHNAFS